MGTGWRHMMNGGWGSWCTSDSCSPTPNRGGYTNLGSLGGSVVWGTPMLMFGRAVKGAEHLYECKMLHTKTPHKHSVIVVRREVCYT